jgi:conserved hypothetical protein|nr:MAG TPA: DNA helix destabilizing protein [Caudoviricetes sp.]
MSINVTTGPATLSWPHLAELEARNGSSKPKVSTAVLVPKSDTDTIEALRDAVREAAAEKWGTKIPKSLRTPLKDGDNSDYEEQADHVTFNCSSIRRVPVVGTDLLPLSDERIDEEVYGGQRARVAVRAFAYEVDGSKGVSFGLQMVQVLGGGERFGGGAASAESLFGPAQPSASRPAVDEDPLAGLM